MGGMWNFSPIRRAAVIPSIVPANCMSISAKSGGDLPANSTASSPVVTIPVAPAAAPAACHNQLQRVKAMAKTSGRATQTWNNMAGNSWLEFIARFGYAAVGVLYLLIGFLSLKLAA